MADCNVSRISESLYKVNIVESQGGSVVSFQSGVYSEEELQAQAAQIQTKLDAISAFKQAEAATGGQNE